LALLAASLFFLLKLLLLLSVLASLLDQILKFRPDVAVELAEPGALV
jgi:hypothetical protein